MFDRILHSAKPGIFDEDTGFLVGEGWLVTESESHTESVTR
ncbi:hypothetical protein CKA32_002944 [Geitlerinema sp. FC II]|nr:hypothetical protein CKA32_002944 [Geitlerinema sp. FC II]